MSTIPVTAGPELARQDIPAPPRADTLWSQLSGFMQRENSVLSALAQDYGADPGPADPNFSLTEYLRGSRHEARFNDYIRLNAFNANRAAQIDRQLDREAENKLLADQLPWYLALPAGVAAGVADPSILMPGAGLIRAARGGYSIARSAAAVSGATAASVAVQEALLQSTQLTRPLEESAINIGAGALLGAFIGAGASSLLSRAEFAQTARGMRQAYTPQMSEAIEGLTPARLREFETAPVARQAELIDSVTYTVPAKTVERPLDFSGTVARGIDNIQAALDDTAKLVDDINSPFVAVAKTLDDLNAGRYAIVAQFDDAEVVARIREAYPERKVFTPEEFRADADFAPAARTEYAPTSGSELSAAFYTRYFTREDSELVGNVAKFVGDKLQWLSPNIRQALNPMPGLRGAWSRLVESPFLTNGAQAGKVANVGGAATRRALFIEAGYLRTKDAVDEVYAKLVKSGQTMAREEFHEKIGSALFYSRLGDNEFVDEAAQLWSKHYDKLFDEGVKAGIFKADIDGADEALSLFFPRDMNTKALVANRPVFVQRAEDWLDGHFQRTYTQQVGELAERKAKLQDKIDFLRLSPEDALREISLLEDQIAAAKVGGKATERSRELQRELGKIRKTEGGQAQAQELIQERIDNLVDASMKSLNRVLEAGQRLERELGTFDARVEVRENYSAKMVETLTAESRRLEKLAEKTQKKLDDIAARQAAMLEANKDPAALAAKRAEMEVELARTQALREELNTINKQTEFLDELNLRMESRFPGATPEEKLEMVREGISFLLARVNEINLERGVKLRALVDKMAKADPSLVRERTAKLEGQIKELDDRHYSRWFDRAMGEQLTPDSVPSFRQLARESANDLADAYLGLGKSLRATDLPTTLVEFTRGPLKKRTNIIPNEIMDPPGDPIQFFHKNAEDVAQLHSRRMSGQIAIGQMFDGDYKLAQIFGDDYQPGLLKTELAQANALVNAARDPAEVYKVAEIKPKRGETLEAAQERARAALKTWFDTSAEDFANAYKAMTGTLYAKENLGDIGTVSRIAKSIAYIRVMGGNGISMFTDLYTPALVLGLRNHFSEGVLPLAFSKDVRALAKEDLNFVGLALNHVANRNVLAMADIGDPLARGTAVERVLDKMVGFASKWNGSQYMQDAGETLAGMTTMQLLMKRARNFEANAKDLADAGIDARMAERITGQIDAHKKTFENVEFPNLAAWTDEGAALAFQAAVGRQVDMIFSTRRVGNTPWVMSHPVGGMILQFQSYSIAQTQTLLLRGMQDNQRRLLQGLIPLTIMGAMVAYTQAALRGQESLEKFEKNVRENPGFLLAEGLDRGSPFPLAFTFSNLVESGTRAAGADMRVNPLKDPVMRAFGQLPSELQYTAQGRDFTSQLLGPTAGFVGQLPGGIGALGTLATGGELTGGQSKAIQSTMPFGSYIGMRQGLQWLFDDLPGGN